MRSCPRLLASTCLISTLLATPVLAQPEGPPPTDGPPGAATPGRPMTQIFFSPSGEVFRSAGPDPYPVALWFAQADQDHDGALSRDEYMQDATRYFKVVDENANEAISSQENSRYEQVLAPEITGFVAQIPQPRPGKSVDAEGQPLKNQPYQKQIVGAAQFGLINEPQPIRAADANFDFKITLAEWTTTSSQRFKVLDLNKDARLTRDELPKTPMQSAIERVSADKDTKKGHRPPKPGRRD